MQHCCNFCKLPDVPVLSPFEAILSAQIETKSQSVKRFYLPITGFLVNYREKKLFELDIQAFIVSEDVMISK